MTPVGRILRSPSDPERAYLRLDDAFSAGLEGLDGYSHAVVLYAIEGAPFDPVQHLRGVFASRDPHRPVPIGWCIVELVQIDDELVTVRGLDAADGAALYDIKPYLPNVDSVPQAVVPKA